MGQPFTDGAARTALKSYFDKARIAPVETAQKMHRIRKIAAGMAACAIEESSQMRMAGESVARDTGELGRGNADRL
jgi:hypothetical protein